MVRERVTEHAGQVHAEFSCAGGIDEVEQRDRILRGLSEIKGLSCHKPDGAFYVYPNVSAYLGREGLKTGGDVARRLLSEAHVVAVPGEAFGTNEHIRLSYATSAAEIDRGIDRMKSFFAKL